MNITFWNVGGKQLDTELVELFESTRADILILAEYPSDEKTLIREAHANSINIFSVPKIACKRISIFTRFHNSRFTHLRETSRYTMKELKIPGMPPILFVFVHLPSKLYAKDEDQFQDAVYFKQDIEEAETDVGHTNTVIVGDFNMNPFDKGMISASALHSVPCLDTAKRIKRKIKNREHSYFYNPSWSLLGDCTSPPGTYYYNSSSYVSYYWNVLDQVVMRPSIADYFNKESLTVITNTGRTPLANIKGRPSVSDHFPIFFKFNLMMEEYYEKSLA